jgi:tetratricopeptide (TPR) repeat protein
MFKQHPSTSINQKKMNSNDDSSCSSDDSDVQFAYMDFTGVDFGDVEEESEKTESEPIGVVKGRDAVRDSNVQENYDMNPTVAANSALVDSFKSMTTNEKEEEALLESANLSAERATISFDKVTASPMDLNEEARRAIEEERYILMNDCYLGTDEEGETKKGPITSEKDTNIIQRIRKSSELLSQGQYIEVICGQSGEDLFASGSTDPKNAMSVGQRIRHCVLAYCTTVAKCIEVELLAVACLNIYMQSNYTGPSLHHGGVSRPGKEEVTYEAIQTINPHALFASQLRVSGIEVIATSKGDGDAFDKQREPPVDPSFHNAVLAELSVDGEWPCPVCKYPYFLLLARSILYTLAGPNNTDWTQNVSHSTEDKVFIRKNESGNFYEPPTEIFVACAESLDCVSIWCGRAIVAHSRLLQGDEPSMTLWEEARSTFDFCVEKYCNGTYAKESNLSCRIFLEYGLAEHHFDRERKGKESFLKALGFSGLDVEVTGAEGRRTKYQQKATAQMLVKAKPTAVKDDIMIKSADNDQIAKQEVKFEDDTILLGKVKYVEDDNNTHFQLSILQQTVLLALCLDVKNENPMDGLTGEQMGAYLERVLQQHDDWMVYASGLLERAWLESEKNHTRERALLQLQALADQHSNRLTLTQSTYQAAVEDSAPPQERLRNIHYIVYPPRWGVLRDLAERYAKIGIVTSAAEMFEEIELWDEVVDCYKRAGKSKKAEKVVRKRLSEAETPRMWAALGDITGDKSHYEKALEVSHGKFSAAHVALGKHYLNNGDLKKSAEHLKVAVRIKPLSPHVWFSLGAVSMRIKDWATALQAFTEVVQQEPEEGDAWANVAAIHMHNKNSGAAYPALNEVCFEVEVVSLQESKLYRVSHVYFTVSITVSQVE